MKPWGLSLLASFCWQEGLSPVVEYWYIGEQHQKEGRTRRSAPTTVAHAGHIGEQHQKEGRTHRSAPTTMAHAGHIAWPNGVKRRASGGTKRTTEPDPMVRTARNA